MARTPRQPGGAPAARPGRPRPPSPARIHNDWLRLVEVSGPFLSIPALIRAFPQGLPKDDSTSPLRKDFRVQLETWEDGRRSPAAHQVFVRFVLEKVLEWPERELRSGQGIPPGLDHPVAEHGETLRPDLVLVNPDGRAHAGKARVLVMVLPPGQGLERSIEGHRWKASPVTRAMELCHAREVPLALVTNGADWTLVHAKRGETTTYANFDAPLFVEEAGLFNAFRALLGVERLFGVADADTLEALLAESAANQQEVTDQLGLQVRQAVEVLVQAIDRADGAARGAILRDVPEKALYEAAVAVMMRLVFTLATEERKLLPYGDPLYDAHYSVSTLLAQLQEVADKHGEEVLERRFAAWARLLASFRAIHGGIDHDRLRLPAYGGSLFDPDRFPFLEGRPPASRWTEVPAKPVRVSDRTVFHLLRALQVLELPVPGGGREARRLSFRALDVEQIGHVYEGLLDHTAVRATEPVLGLAGAKGQEPELPLSAVVMAHDRGEDYLVEYLGEQTGKSEAALRKAIQAASDPDLEAVGRLLQACGNDEQLKAAVAPWARLLRTDSSGYPVVIRKGSVYVTAGTDRRSSGTHYTPRSLTEPVVQYALEPQVYRGPAEGWPREKWQLKTPKELLALRVCDMAMGSGAFLAQACRWLGDRLVESWEEAEAKAGGKLVVTPEGDLATGAPNERPIPRSAEERIALARRAVAERCLYGVDINPMAVEIAKLSLWLVTLQKDRPFTFVDHALRCGDSLLGVTSPEQIAHFHLDPEKGKALHKSLFNWTAACEPALREALEKRRKLESFTVESARDAEDKQRLLSEANKAIVGVQYVADAVVAAALATSDRGADAYATELEILSQLVSTTFDEAARPGSRDSAREQLVSKVDRLLNAGKPPPGARRQPFHWALEFPEVFSRRESRPGFDGIIGNPPYAGGQKITGALGTDFRDFCVRWIAQDRRGSADLCSYFFLRASQTIGASGTIGLVSTNTISQGDTRTVGLDQLIGRGCTIYRAVSSQGWPGEANLEVAHVWIAAAPWLGQRFLDGRASDGISTYLTDQFDGDSAPLHLRSNEGRSYQGSIVHGMGFVLTPDEAQRLIKRDQRNREALSPYLNGEDLNSRPDQSPSRWVIDFKNWPLDRATAPNGYEGPVARDYPDLIRVVEELVKPERLKNNRKVYRDRWWQYAEKRPDLYQRISGLADVIVCSEVTKHLAFAIVPNACVFSANLDVFADCDVALLGALQSNIHEVWARRYSATLETRLKYSPGNAFETFPLPALGEALRTEASNYLACRRACGQAGGEGLTQVYNRVHSAPEDGTVWARFRDAIRHLDTAVMAAYGWTSLDLGHGFHETKQGIRFTISESARREVLARLLKLNHERYAEEVKQGLHDEGKKKAKAKPVAAAQGSLFGGEPARPAAKPRGRN